MDIQTKYLNKLKDDKTFVRIYTDHYDDSREGFIIDFNEDFLLLEEFDTNSQADGISIFLTENITRIKWGGNEMASMVKFIEPNKRMKDLKTIDLATIETVLKSVFKLFKHITLYLQDIDKNICIIGEIHEMDDEYIVMKAYGSQATLDTSFQVLNIDDITKIQAGGMYENNLKKLFEEKTGFHAKDK